MAAKMPIVCGKWQVKGNKFYPIRPSASDTGHIALSEFASFQAQFVKASLFRRSESELSNKITLREPPAGLSCLILPQIRTKKQMIMAGKQTLTMIKPDAVKANNIGPILAMMTEGGFKIKAMKLTRLSKEKAGEFYAVHRERPFYGELVDFMSSGPIVAAILEKDNAVNDFRTLIGATNPADAAEGTIRKRFATSIGENAVHGSDSDENAAIEGDFFFSRLERI
jgi:nucleoside-diphosphate kinase